MSTAKDPRTLRTNSMNLNPVIVRVGKDPYQEQFLAHEGTLIKYSEFFKRALSGSWVESDLRIITLPEDDPEIFELFLNYLYTKQLPIQEQKDYTTLTEEEYGSQFNRECERVGQIYVMGEKLQSTIVKNAAIFAILGLTKLRDFKGELFVPNPNMVRDIYEGTPPGNPARRFLVDIWTEARVDAFSSSYDLLPKEFFRDLVMEFSRTAADVPENWFTRVRMERYIEKAKDMDSGTNNAGKQTPKET